MKDEFVTKMQVREAILKEFGDKLSPLAWSKLKKCTGAIPPADVKPIVKGEWKRTGEYLYGEKWQCTHCEEINQWRARFCPNCGADMRGE